jgi:hypothetical protein
MRHLDQRAALSRITVIAKRDTAVGEELLVTYLDPSLGVREWPSQLVAWGFGQRTVSGVTLRRRGEERAAKRMVRKRLRLKSGRLWTTWRES